jgi:hypothetical protein
MLLAYQVIQTVLACLRILVGENFYPPEPEPPTDPEQAIHFLQQLVGGCDGHPTPSANRGRKHRNEERDKWIYEQCMDEALKYDAIWKRLREKIKSEGLDWVPIKSKQALHQAAVRYAERTGRERLRRYVVEEDEVNNTNR